MKLKIAILIADSQRNEYLEIKNRTHQRIWDQKWKENCDIFYMRGLEINAFNSLLSKEYEKLRFSHLSKTHRAIEIVRDKLSRSKIDSVTLESNILSIQIPDTLRNLGKKLIASYKYLHENRYDFVLKTTISSLFNFDNFQKFLNNLSQNQCEFIYSGNIVNRGPSQLASGANLLLNRNCIELILANYNKWDHSVLDDVAIGKIMKNQKIDILQMNSLNISEQIQIDQLSRVEIEETIHYRCRTFSKPRNDIEIINSLLNKLK